MAMSNGLHGAACFALLLDAISLFVLASCVFDAIHYTLHRLQDSRRACLRWLGGLHQAHHAFCDRELVYHESRIRLNLLMHVIPEYGTQMAACALGFAVFDPISVGTVMGIFTAIFIGVLILRGKDRNHSGSLRIPPAHGTLLVRAPYHALHHVYADCYLGSYTTLFDRLMGTACQIRGRRFALTGASGAFGSALKDLLESAGAEVLPLKCGVDYTDGEYSGCDSAMSRSDVLVLAHGSKGRSAMWSNYESYVALIERFRELTRSRLVSPEVWAVGSEIECHPTFGISELRDYARSKRAYARVAARLFHDKDLLYRHIVPSAFQSRMGPGFMSGRLAARITLRLIRHGFRYVPVTYTGIAFVNFVPFIVRSIASQLASPNRQSLPSGPRREPRPAARIVGRRGNQVHS